VNYADQFESSMILIVNLHGLFVNSKYMVNFFAIRPRFQLALIELFCALIKSANLKGLSRLVSLPNSVIL
jgi:hypothetical protein